MTKKYNGALSNGRAYRGVEGPGFLNPKTSDKKLNFPEPGIPERPRSKHSPSPAFCCAIFFQANRSVFVLESPILFTSIHLLFSKAIHQTHLPDGALHDKAPNRHRIF